MDQLQEIRGLCISLLGTPFMVSRGIKPTAISSVVNSTYKEVASKTRLLDEEFIIAGGSVEDQEEYSLDTSVFKVQRVWYDGYRLSPQADRPSNQSSGVTAQYRVGAIFTGSGKLYLDPIPNESGVVIKYKALIFPATLSAGDSVSEFADMYNMTVAMGACHYLTLGTPLNQQYKSEYRRLLGELYDIGVEQTTEKFSMKLQDGQYGNEVTDIYRF